MHRLLDSVSFLEGHGGSISAHIMLARSSDREGPSLLSNLKKTLKPLLESEFLMKLQGISQCIWSFFDKEDSDSCLCPLGSGGPSHFHDDLSSRKKVLEIHFNESSWRPSMIRITKLRWSHRSYPNISCY